MIKLLQIGIVETAKLSGFIDILHGKREIFYQDLKWHPVSSLQLKKDSLNKLNVREDEIAEFKLFVTLWEARLKSIDSSKRHLH